MVCQGNTIYRVALIYRCVLRVLNFVADAGNDFGFQRVSYPTTEVQCRNEKSLHSSRGATCVDK